MKLRIALASALILAAGPGLGGEQAVGANGRTALAVTVYGNGLALIKETRKATLAKGRNVLAIEGVGTSMIPESVSLSADGMTVSERNFEFDLLTPEAILKQSVGRKVGIVRTHPTTGEESIERATVLSVAGGVVLKAADGKILTGVPGRLVFDQLPEGLRAKPTLLATVMAGAAGKKNIDLHYLTGNMSWHADYTLTIADDEKTFDLEGWATITNTSGAEYRDATLKLIAGDVRRQSRPQGMVDKVAEGMMMARAAPADAPRQEVMGDVHLYAVPGEVTLRERETKQIALLARHDVKMDRRYTVQSGYGFGRIGDTPPVNPSVSLMFENAGKGAEPLPQGIVRTYRRDKSGAVQFNGEATLRHTPVGETIELPLGRAFDITVRRTQTEFIRLTQPKAGFEAAFKIAVKNAKEEAATVRIVEAIPGDWQIVEESQPHAKDSRQATWNVVVPAKGTAELGYRVRVKQ